ncbi:hypothetical protein [Sorangium sp. So ce233]|uniref:hypothetical protein n=1 Tax=Sorangium sp. So ce233 TaxID=3133290 RepID=UPI003F6058C1
MFASKSLVEHVARGLLGLGAFAASALLAPAHPWAALALLPVGLVALRGCPMCWTLGLIQTVMARVARARGVRPEGPCRPCHAERCAPSLTDGSSARTADPSPPVPRRPPGRVDSPGSPH